MLALFAQMVASEVHTIDSVGGLLRFNGSGLLLLRLLMLLLCLLLDGLPLVRDSCLLPDGLEDVERLDVFGIILADSLLLHLLEPLIVPSVPGIVKHSRLAAGVASEGRRIWWGSVDDLRCRFPLPGPG